MARAGANWTARALQQPVEQQIGKGAREREGTIEIKEAR